MLENIGMVWVTSINMWLQNYEFAKDYFFEYGNLNVPRGYTTSSGFKLGKWIVYQRNLYKTDGGLSKTQIKLLDDIKMIWDLKSYNWHVKYLKAKKYFDIHENLDVPRNFITSDGFKLGNWIKIQREAYKNRYIPRSEWTHEILPLTDEQVEALENLKIVWNLRENEWLRNFSYAKKYFDIHGNLDVPYRYVTTDGFSLYEWLYFQRSLYKNKGISKETSSLDDWKIDLLNSIGMIWEKRRDKWQRGYFHAKEYYLEHGNLIVPRSYVTSDGFKLGYWILFQRYAYSNIGLPKEKRKYSFLPLDSEQVALLEEIGMVWNVRNHVFLTTSFSLKKKIKLERMFLEFLNEYAKDNKVFFESYDDVQAISNGFMKSLGKIK